MNKGAESAGTRIINGQVFRVTKLPTGFGGRSISKAAFGGKLGAKTKGQHKDSTVERKVVR